MGDPIGIGAGGGDIIFAHGAVWVTNGSDGSVTRVDAVTRETTRYEVGVPVTAVAGPASRTDGRIYLLVPQEG